MAREHNARCDEVLVCQQALAGLEPVVGMVRDLEFGPALGSAWAAGPWSSSGMSPSARRR
ncbi:MAG: hypothetical protein AB1445_04155 [Bacillota bacterium]